MRLLEQRGVTVEAGFQIGWQTTVGLTFSILGCGPSRSFFLVLIARLTG